MLERYMRAAHAMQSGVLAMILKGDDESSPKHLRTGVNSAMVEHAALIRILINKGIITEEEYYEALANEMELEQKRYEDKLGCKLI